MARATINGVSQYYGPRNTYEGAAGTEGTRDDTRKLVVFFSGLDYASVRLTLPGPITVVSNALFEVSEAFNLGGTTPTLSVGVSGSAATNRFGQLSEAQAEAIGTYSVAPAGTLALNTPKLTDTIVAVELGGTTPTATAAGRAKMVVDYTSI